MTVFSSVEPTWDQPVYIVGGGPSLSDFDFGRLRGKGLLLGTNKWTWLAGCDVLFSLDQQFIRSHRRDIETFIANGGEAYLAVPINTEYQVDGATFLIHHKNPGLSEMPHYIFGTNSGFGALNLAYLKGAKEIGLLGFDMQSRGGQIHWGESYAWHHRTKNDFYRSWSDKFGRAADQLHRAGVNVVNFVGRPESRITAFPKASLDDL